MAIIPQTVVNPIAEAIYSHYKAVYGSEKSRPYLGASSIGKPCNRAHWYSFHWAKPAQFSGRLYRLFQSGHLQEPRVLKDLRAIGCKVEGIDPATGKQWSFSEESCGHHFAGNLDGVITGVPGAPKTRHVLEIKTSSDKMFKVMLKDGVQKSKPEHYAQMQIYMHWSKCDRALYFVVNKDNDEIYTERVEYDKAFALGLIEKSRAIIESNVPPARLSDDPTWFECKFCDYQAICHGQDLPAVNCRSCAHSTPVMTGHGAWTCGKYDSEIPQDAQREGCNGHIYIPILLERCARPVDGDESHVVYEMSNGARFTNGDPDEFGEHISSKEIHAVADKSALVEPRVIELRREMLEQFPETRLAA
jgi:hypothetical protein